MQGGRRSTLEVPGLAELFTRQAGLARRSQLRALGVTRDHVAEQVAAGRWRLVAPEVVTADTGRLDAEQNRWRAVLHATCAWLGGRSALEHLGLSGYAPDEVHVLVPRDRVPARLTGVRVHITARLPDEPPGGWASPPAVGGHRGRPTLVGASEARSLPVTSAARAAVDAAAWERHPRAAAGLVLAVVQQRLASAAAIDAELALAGRVRHRAVVREALADAVGGAESLAEVDVVPLLRRAGLSEPRRQVRSGASRHDLEVDLPDGRVLVIEVDGPHHDSPEARWADAERDVRLVAEGKLLLRIPSYAVRREPQRVVARLRGIVDSAGSRASSRR